LKKIVDVALVVEIKYEYAVLIGTPAGRDLLQALDIDGIFHIIIGCKICLKVPTGFRCLKIME
jgi:hypothetical protein